MPNPPEQPPVYVNARFLTQPVTGVQRFAAEICLRLKTLRPDLVFVAPRNIMQPQLAAQLQVVTFGRFTSHVWEQLELPRYLSRKNNPLLLNLCNTAPCFYRQNIVCIHDIAFAVNPRWFSALFVKLYTFLIPRIARSSLKVLTVSNFSKSEIQRYTGIAAEKITVIYNGLTTGVIQTHSSPARGPYGNYILAVSSVDPRKNLINLVKAFKQANLPNLNLVIVGAASRVFADAGLKAEIKNCAAIIFTGYLPDPELAGIYRGALLFVYPSLYEGFGIPPLEAMANGVPTIVSEAAALPEVCGDASLYINPTDVDDMASKIKLLVQQKALRETLAAKGLQKVLAYSWEQSAEKVNQVLKTIR